MDFIIISLALIYLIIATISDIKTQEIPDSLNFSFVFIGLFVNALRTFTSNDNSYLLYSLLTFGAFFIVGRLMYYSKQWGGGDAKLLAGMGALVPLYPMFTNGLSWAKTTNYFGLDFFINLILVGAIYTIIYAIYLSIKNRKKFIENFKEIYLTKKTKKFEKIIWVLVILINAVGIFILKTNAERTLLLSISLLLLLFNYLLVFTKAVEKTTMYKTISTQKLREGDCITSRLKSDDKIVYTPSVHGVKKSQIELIQKHFKEVHIKEGISFAPTFLIAFLVTILKGNSFLFILTPF
jgi:hypothetical protein